MNNQVVSFAYEDLLCRALVDAEGNPWFVAKDVCQILDLTDTYRAVENLEEDEKGTSKVRTLGGEQAMIIISESGLYTLIFRSNKPNAKTFRKWVTSEVLPSLRKTGRYEMPGMAAGPGPEAEEPELEKRGPGRPRKIDGDNKQSNNLYFAMSRMVETADKFLEGRAALKALNFFTGMPVDDLLEELDRREQGRVETDLDAYGRDVVGDFVYQCCVVDTSNPLLTETGGFLYAAFAGWYETEIGNGPAPSITWFGRRMAKKFKKTKGVVVQYHGIGLKPEWRRG